MRASRPSSRMASVLTSSGMPAASSFLRRSSTSRWRIVAFAQFLLNGLQLLAQIELALALGELSLHLRLDAAAQFDQLQLAREMRGALRSGARAPSVCSSSFWRSGMAQGGQVARHEIGQAARLGDLAARGGKVVREVGRGRHDLLEQADHVLPQGFDFGRDFRFDLGDALDARLEKRLAWR